MNSANSHSQQKSSPEFLADEQFAELELLAIEDVMEQGNVALLKSQLAAAHQLLQYQQNLVHSLTEQVQIKEMHLQHAERQVDELQQNCQSQTVELAEMRSICTDLRSLLKRQNRRSPQAPSVAQPTHPVSFEMHAPQPVRTAISFGYESVRHITTESHHLTKAPPVQAWSALQTDDYREEITFCQKLTTFIMSSTARIAPTEPALDIAAQRVSLPGREPAPVRSRATATHHDVELPRFALG